MIWHERPRPAGTGRRGPRSTRLRLPHGRHRQDPTARRRHQALQETLLKPDAHIASRTIKGAKQAVAGTPGRGSAAGRFTDVGGRRSRPPLRPGAGFADQAAPLVPRRPGRRQVRGRGCRHQCWPGPWRPRSSATKAAIFRGWRRRAMPAMRDAPITTGSGHAPPGGVLRAASWSRAAAAGSGQVSFGVHGGLLVSALVSPPCAAFPPLRGARPITKDSSGVRLHGLAAQLESVSEIRLTILRKRPAPLTGLKER